MVSRTRVWVVALSALTSVASGLASAQTSGEVTYGKDIAPILQRSCENCHRADGAAPMPLTTYEEVRPWARSIKQKTGLGPEGWRDAAVVHGEEHRHPEISERSIPERRRRLPGLPGGPTAARRRATLPTCRRRGRGGMPSKWAIGEPDLIVKTTELNGEGERARLWEEIPRVPIPRTEDRYVVALEIKEVNDVDTRGLRAANGRRPLRLSSHDLGHPRGKPAGSSGRRPDFSRYWTRAPPRGRSTRSAGTPTFSASTPRGC